MTRSRRGVALWMDAMNRANWSVLDVNVPDDLQAEYLQTRTPASLSNYVSGDPVYGQPSIDPQSLNDLLTPGESAVWVYNISVRLWCIFGKSEVALIQAGSDFIQHNLMLDLVQKSLLSDASATATIDATLKGKIEVIIEKQGLVRPATTGNNITVYRYTTGLITIPNTTGISCQLRDYSGKPTWWSMSAIDYYKLGMTTTPATSNIMITGRAAVLVNTPNGPIWKLGRTITIAAPASSYAAYFTNYDANDIFRSAPPVMVDGYILSKSNYWVYHTSYKLWLEVGREGYILIQKANTVSTINYIHTTTLDGLSCNQSTADGKVAAGAFEIFWHACPQKTPIQSMSVDTKTPFNRYSPYLFSEHDTVTDTMGDLVYMDNTFYAIYKQQIILEPIITNNVTTWRFNTVEGLQLSRISKKIHAPVTLTGSVAVYIDGAWHLGRNSLYGTGLDQPENFALIVENLPVSTTLQSRFFVYHLQHLVQYEVDLESFLRIRQIRQVASFVSTTNKIVPMVLTNASSITGVNGTGAIEVFVERLKTAPPPVETLKYPGQQVGTILDGDLTTQAADGSTNIFGVDASLSTFTIPHVTDIVPVWDYRANGWCALYLDQLISVPDDTGSNYSLSLIQSLLVKGRTASIDSMVQEVQTVLTKLAGFTQEGETSITNIDAAWQAAGLSQGRVKEIQAASDLAKAALNGLQQLSADLNTNLQQIINVNRVYTNAKTNSDVMSLYSIYKNMVDLVSTSNNTLVKATGVMASITAQESIATGKISTVTRILNGLQGVLGSGLNFGQGMIANAQASINNLVTWIKKQFGL